MKNKNKIAIFFDCENINLEYIEKIYDEVNKFGEIIINKGYANWNESRHNKWREILAEFAIEQIQPNTSDKNSSDIKITIDVMNILCDNKIDIIVIVSSDSDFTRLASRIRENGLVVYGFGEKKTPKAFMGACDKFIYTENLRSDDVDEHQRKKSRYKDIKQDKKTIALMKGVVEDLADESGWSYLATIGNVLVKRSPEFDPRSYGFYKLSELMKYSNEFEFKEDSFSPTKAIYIRCKRVRRGY